MKVATVYDEDFVANDDAITTGLIRTGEEDRTLIAIVSTLDQALSIQVQGTMEAGDEATWFDVGDAIVVAAGDSTPAQEVETISDPWPHLRMVITPGGTPNEGSLKIMTASKRTGGI